MKLAVIAPLQCLDVVNAVGLSYHMALGQELVRDSGYSNAYLAMHERGDFIIVDNGAAEKDILPFAQIVLAANIISADEIALPDVLRDMKQTVIATREGARLVPKQKRMLIPQGKDWTDWDECVRQLMRIGGGSLGIPKLLGKYVGGRERALDYIKSQGIYTEIDIHLLGANIFPLDEIRSLLRQFPWIRGIDTAAPIAYAQYGKSITWSDRKSLLWDSETNFETAHRNIITMRDVCNGK